MADEIRRESRYLHTELHLCNITVDSMYIENANRFMGMWGTAGGRGGGGGRGRSSLSISNSDDYLRMVQIREGVGFSFFFQGGGGGGGGGGQKGRPDH